jgi:hypothetical protein
MRANDDPNKHKRYKISPEAVAKLREKYRTKKFVGKKKAIKMALWRHVEKMDRIRKGRIEVFVRFQKQCKKAKDKKKSKACGEVRSMQSKYYYLLPAKEQAAFLAKQRKERAAKAKAAQNKSPKPKSPKPKGKPKK